VLTAQLQSSTMANGASRCVEFLNAVMPIKSHAHW
jgi:hypothetical protein